MFIYLVDQSSVLYNIVYQTAATIGDSEASLVFVILIWLGHEIELSRYTYMSKQNIPMMEKSLFTFSSINSDGQLFFFL